MCGRFSQRFDVQEAGGLLGAVVPGDFTGCVNIAPTEAVGVLRLDRQGQPAFGPVRWGLIPSWAKDESIGAQCINARSETAAEKPAFREALRRRRCVVPADRWYEWQGRGKTRQPFAVFHEDGNPLLLAGLWEAWTSPEGRYTETCTILTTDATGHLGNLHHRRPVVLHPSQVRAWLGPATPLPRVQAILTGDHPEGLTYTEISPAINNARNKAPNLTPVPVQGGLFDP